MDPTVQWTNIPTQQTNTSPAMSAFVSGGEWKMILVGFAVVVALMLLGGFALTESAKVDVE